MYKFLATTLLVVLLAAGCGSSSDGEDLAAGDPTTEAGDGQSTPTPPADTDPAPDDGAAPGTVVGSWWATSIDGKQVPSDLEATLIFDDAGMLGGNTSCNSYSTTYTTDGDAMTLGEVAATLRLCEPAANEQEMAFLAVLNDVATYKVDKNVLTLNSSAGTSITASNIAPEAPASGSAVGTWAVTTIDGAATTAGPSATLIFDDAGMLSGNASCNPYSATYSLAGDKVTLGEIAIGASLCDDAANQQETAFLAVLNDLAVLTVDGSTLTLQTTAGQTLTATRA